MADNKIILYILPFLTLPFGVIVGYYVRQFLAKQRAGSLEAKLEKRVQDVKQETADLVKKSETKAAEITEKAQGEIDQRRREFLKAQQVLLDREKLLDGKIETFDKKEVEFQTKTEKLKSIKEDLDKL